MVDTIFTSPRELKEESIRFKSAVSSLRQQIKAEKISARKEKRVADTTGMETNVLYSKEESKELSGRAKAIEKKRKTLKEKLSKLLRKKVISRRVLKKSQATVTIKERPRENIFHEENRFFKGEFNQEKKNMFLS